MSKTVITNAPFTFRKHFGGNFRRRKCNTPYVRSDTAARYVANVYRSRSPKATSYDLRHIPVITALNF